MSDARAGSGLSVAMPLIADLRAAVLRAARDDEEVWAAVCQAARAAPHTASESDVRDRLVQAAKDRGGAVGIAALSFEVRLRTYQTLSALTAARTAR